MAYVTVVVQLFHVRGSLREHNAFGTPYKNIIANPQIFRSRAGDRKRLREKGSTSPSERSRLIRRTMNAHSFSLRNLQDLCALSGKSTRKVMVRMPITPVICWN